MRAVAHGDQDQGWRLRFHGGVRPATARLAVAPAGRPIGRALPKAGAVLGGDWILEEVLGAVNTAGFVVNDYEQNWWFCINYATYASKLIGKKNRVVDKIVINMKQTLQTNLVEAKANSLEICSDKQRL